MRSYFNGLELVDPLYQTNRPEFKITGSVLPQAQFGNQYENKNTSWILLYKTHLGWSLKPEPKKKKDLEHAWGLS